jgi:hypothetical protein
MLDYDPFLPRSVVRCLVSWRLLGSNRLMVMLDVEKLKLSIKPFSLIKRERGTSSPTAGWSCLLFSLPCAYSKHKARDRE